MRNNKKKIISLITIPTISLAAFSTSISLAKNEIIKSNEFYQNNLIDTPLKIINKAVVDNGINIVFVGDGYKQDQQQILFDESKRAFERFFNFPQYMQLKQYVNVYVLSTVSNQDLETMAQNSKDTYFETHLKGQTRVPGYTIYGRKKIVQLMEQVTNNVAQDNSQIRAHISINTKKHLANSFGYFSASSNGANIDYENTFVHEMSHNVGLADEYAITGSHYASNRSLTGDPNKIFWKEFLGYRNTGIKKELDTEFTKQTFYRPNIKPGDVCIMRNTSRGAKFCEVCKYYSFKSIVNNLDNQPMYITKPFISESFDSSKDYNVPKEEISNDNLIQVKNKKIDLRFLADNPSNQNIKLKLKLEYKNQTRPETNQTKEEIFIIEPTNKQIPKPKQIKITFDNELDYNQGENATIVGSIYNADSNEMIVNTKSRETSDGFEYEDQKKFTINFLDNSTKKTIDMIEGPQTYNFFEKSSVENIKPTNIRGYKFVKAEKLNEHEWNWYYDKKPERKLTLNLYDSTTNKIIESKQRSLFEGEFFETSSSDFMYTKSTTKGVVQYNKQKISYNDPINEINYWLEYPKYRIAASQKSYQIEQGQAFDINDKAVVEVEKNYNSWVKSEQLTKSIIIERNNFNNYIVGQHKIKYIFKDQSTEINVNVTENKNLTQDQKDIIEEMKRLTSSPMQLNSLGKQTNIMNVDQNNIEQYVNNWPVSQNQNIKISLEKFESFVATGSVLLKFKFQKANYELFHEVWLRGFVSDELDVDNEVLLVNSKLFSFQVDSVKVEKTHIDDVNDSNIKTFIKNFPTPSKQGVKIDGYIKEVKKYVGGANIFFACKVTKNNVSKITNGFWIEGFKNNKNDNNPKPPIDQNEQDKKLVELEIEKLNKKPIKINELGKKTNIKDVTSNNINTYVSNWPIVENGIQLSIESFQADFKQGSVTFNLKFSLNNYSKSINVYVDGFVVDKDDENIVQPPNPPIKPPIEPPASEKPETNDSTTKNSKFAPWKIGLIVGSSVLGVGLIVLAIWWFIKIKKK